MREVGQSSNSFSQNHEIWAKLVPLDSRYEDVEIRTSVFVISSEIKSCSQEKREWCKITRNQDFHSATIQNKSTNTILVDEAAIPDEDSVVIHCGSEIIPGPHREGYMSYRFRVMPRPESLKELLKICFDVEHAKCSICLNIWHDVVTVSPCFHNFCNGCFSEWLRRSQEKMTNVLCPQCRAVVKSVGRNSFLHNITEDILKADSSLKHSDEEVAVLNSYASISSNLVIRSGRKSHHKRPRSPPIQQTSENASQPNSSTPNPLPSIQESTPAQISRLEECISRLDARVRRMETTLDRLCEHFGIPVLPGVD